MEILFYLLNDLNDKMLVPLVVGHMQRHLACSLLFLSHNPFNVLYSIY